MKSRFDGLGDISSKAKAVDAATSSKRAVKNKGSDAAAAKPARKQSKRKTTDGQGSGAEPRSFEIRVAMTFTEDDPVGAAFAKMLSGLPPGMARDIQLGRPFKRAVLNSLDEIATHLK